MSEKSGGLLERLVPVLLIASVALAFAVGVLWQKVRNLEGDDGKVAGVADPSPIADQPQGPAQGKLPKDQADRLALVTDEDHIRGSRNAEVYLIEYSDYECPFCSRFHTTAQQVVDEYAGRVSWVYRHFPLDQLHADARPAAEASECVADLLGEDGFWKFTDELFANQQTALRNLESSATKTGVNLSAYKSCVDSKKFAGKVESQYQTGVAVGVTGTPGNLLLNSKGEVWLIPGALPFEQLRVSIDEALSS